MGGDGAPGWDGAGMGGGGRWEEFDGVSSTSETSVRRDQQPDSISCQIRPGGWGGGDGHHV